VIGSRFGPFEVTARLGAGGMGEVYRARDPRLGRDVAIKVLSATLSTDAERLARFEREARLLASLNHPNIGAIYGLEQANGQSGLILELIDGPTLGEAILRASARQDPRGAFQEADALSIASQIADGLEAAHDRGIIHRDLKPANIKLTTDGLVKILDFGLAKADEPPAPETGNDTTRATVETASGLALGTPRYMSPEQARGEPVNGQTDIWAFGCVLFELLTGRPAFDGRTVPDVMAAVLGADPDWRLLPAATSLLVRRLLRRCLEKDRRQRLRHIGDVRLDVGEARQPPLGATATGRSAVDFRRLTDSPGLKEHPALSPDGKTVAFTASTGGKRQIWIQLVAGGAALQLTRDRSDHDEPRWLPDSSRLIYFVPAKRAGESGSIWEIAALGGAARRLTSALQNGDISPDGARLAMVRRGTDGVELVVAALDGAYEQVVARLTDSPFSYFSPRWSPDGHTLALTRASFAAFETRLLVVPASGGEAVSIARADWIRGHAWRPDSRGLIYSASTGNTLPYPPMHNLRAVNLDGRDDRPLTFGDASYLQPDVRSPGHVVVTRARGRSDIWIFPVDGPAAANTANATSLTHQTGHVQTPSMSPDGREFVYVSDHGGHSNLWVAAVDGSDLRQLTFERDPETIIGVAHWSPRGDLIVFVAAKHGRISLRLVAPDGSGLRPFVSEGFGAAWSYDGQWVYFMTRASEIYKISVEDGTRFKVRDGSGPTLSRDGRVLYFVSRTAAGENADWSLSRAEPEDGPAEIIGTIASQRLPFSPRFTPHLHLSPDQQWLAVPLTDGETTNIWRFPVRGGPPQQVTDFADRATLIVRWVCWTPDGRHIAAAVADRDTDIVWMDGLL
jgi:serine/threonine protein kinase/WD40 repeat protein